MFNDKGVGEMKTYNVYFSLNGVIRVGADTPHEAEDKVDKMTIPEVLKEAYPENYTLAKEIWDVEEVKGGE